MDPVEYLRALRRWWLLILGLTLVGLVAAFVTSSGSSAPLYRAVTILAQDGDSNNTVGLAREAFQVTSSDVSNRVAKQLGEDPRAVSTGVAAQADPTLNAIVITVEAASADGAVTLADAYGSALVASLDDQAQTAKQAAVDQQNQVIAALQAQLAAVPPVSSQASNLQSQISDAQSKLADLQASGSASVGLSTLQRATASRATESTSRVTRLAIGGIMGLLVGIVIVLVLTRFDTRIRTKEAAERAFEAPVLGEVPSLKRSLRSSKSIVAVRDPESLSAEVYRSLRTALVVASSVARTPRGEAGQRATLQRGLEPPAQAAPLVVVVASPGMGEGKTTTSANLAVTFAESGKRVLVLGCDLRRPELHNYFGVSEAPGLTEELAKPRHEQSLSALIKETSVPGVSIAPSGEPVEHPGELLTRNLDLISSARQLVDVVVIDTPPLLATDDASVLIPLADAVVVVCRSGVTSMEAAARARELLERMHAMVAGVVLIGAEQLPSARSYYRLDYRSRGRQARRAGSGAGAQPTADQVEREPDVNERPGLALMPPERGDSQPSVESSS